MALQFEFREDLSPIPDVNDEMFRVWLESALKLLFKTVQHVASVITIAEIDSPAAMTVEHHTASDTLTEDESGSVHTNSGAVALLTLSLPDNPPDGTYFYFIDIEDNAVPLIIKPGAATSTIKINNDIAAGWSIRELSNYATSIGLVYNSNTGNWYPFSVAAIWQTFMAF